MVEQPAQKSVTILGSTGSIGQSTIDVMRQHPERFRAEALIANRNVESLARDARALGAKVAVIGDETRLEDLRHLLQGSDIEAAAGIEAVCDAARRPVDMTMASIVGADGLRPTLAALEQGGTVCLANKECLVSAGDLFMRRVRETGSRLVPVDSEHSAIHQCLEERNSAEIDRIILTASGGPFRQVSHERLKTVTREDALKHPNWAMGQKITIDSATLMNKGLELIEAFHLFATGVEKLEAVVHPQSIVHSLVSYKDGSVLAQLGMPDMRTPIAWAMAYPGRVATTVDRLDLAALGQLTFQPVDHVRFPAVKLCLNALESGGSATTVLNAANEVAVAEFLAQRIGFLAIPALVENVLDAAERDSMVCALGDLSDVWQADEYGRRMAAQLARKLQ